MSRLIDADKLETDMLYAMCGTGYQHLAMSTIRSARTIEAKPVRHGHWDTIKNAYGEVEGFIHAECGRTSNSKDNYCPNCGAKMGGRRMEPKEAIEIFSNPTQHWPNERECAISAAIDALEKQIPIAPEKIAEDDDGIYKQYICPKCERFLTFGNPVPFERPHHCRCGQKLLWRMEGEE